MIEGNALGALEGLGVAVSDEELNERVATVRADDLATIVYTSGSTGNPKGAELTHKNFVSITISASQALHEVVLDDHPRLLLFLPLAHCFARFIQYASIASDDGVVGYLPDTKTLLPDLRSFEPTYLLGVPRVFEKVYNAASHKAGAGWKGRLFVKRRGRARLEPQGAGRRAAHVCRNRRARQVRNARLPHGARCSGPEDQVRGLRRRTTVARSGAFLQRHRTADDSGLWHDRNRRPVRRHARDRQCDRHRRPARARLLDSHFRRRRTAGQGPNVFRGYHNLPEKTAEAFTADGWLRTGDLAEIDDAGHIVITGRIKDIIITAGGKNVSPIPLEEEIAKCPIVEHCVVVGDQRPFIGALVTLDPESLALWLPAHGLSTETPVDRLATNAAVREEIQQYVDKANATVSRAESVRKFAVLDTQFTQENKCLTPSLKVVRPAVNRVFADVIDNEIYNGKR